MKEPVIIHSDVVFTNITHPSITHPNITHPVPTPSMSISCNFQARFTKFENKSFFKDYYRLFTAVWAKFFIFRIKALGSLPRQ